MKENIIKSLIDLRLIEATKKKISHKLITIAENLGDPIISENSYGSILPDYWEYEIDDPYDADRISDAEDNTESHIGYHYDSLKHGFNFEILLRSYDDKISLLRANLNGAYFYSSCFS